MLAGLWRGARGMALLQGLHDLIGDEHRAGKGLAAMDHPVATASISCMEPMTPLSLVHQSVQHGLDGLGVGGMATSAA